MTARARLIPVASSLLAILLAVIVGGLFLEARGHDAIEAYRILIRQSLLNHNGLTETFKKMAPVLIVSGGLVIALKAGVWNIGVDGQFLVGALCAAVVGADLAGDVPRWVMFAAAVLAGFLGGLLWAVIPAILSVRWGLNEIITTLMMNYVGINVTAWLVKGPFKDPDRVAPETTKIPLVDRLPYIPGTQVHIGLIGGAVVILLVAVLFRSTVLGYMLTVIGRNKRAAIHAGIPVGMLSALALLLSGGFAGMAGANDVLGVQGVFKANWNPSYGFMGFALVYLARLSSLAVIPFAFFFSFLIIGGDSMSRRANVPTYYVDMLEGLMLIFFAFAVYLERRFFTAPDRMRADEGELAAIPAGAGEAA
jgi:general nucleoside transport system permease protein